MTTKHHLRSILAAASLIFASLIGGCALTTDEAIDECSDVSTFDYETRCDVIIQDCPELGSVTLGCNRRDDGYDCYCNSDFGEPANGPLVTDPCASDVGTIRELAQDVCD